MSHHTDAAVQSEPPFDMRDDGRVKTTWKTLIGVIGFAAMAGAAYYKLQDHDRRLANIETKVDQVQQIAIEIKARLPDRR